MQHGTYRKPNTSYTAETAKEIMKRFRSGISFDREQAQTDMLGYLDGYIRWLLRNVYSGFTRYHEDMMQEAACAVILHMDSYDADLTKPSTYFAPYIMAGLNEFIGSFVYGTTRGEAVKIVKTRKAIEELEKNGSWSLIDLMAKTKYSEKSVKNILCILSLHNTESIDADAFGEISDQSFDPESVYIEKEEMSSPLLCLNRLTETEREIFTRRAGVYDAPLSYEEVSRLLDMPIVSVRKKYHNVKEKVMDYYRAKAI